MIEYLVPDQSCCGRGRWVGAPALANCCDAYSGLFLGSLIFGVIYSTVISSAWRDGCRENNFWSALTCQRFGRGGLAPLRPTNKPPSRQVSTNQALTSQRTPKVVHGTVQPCRCFFSLPCNYARSPTLRKRKRLVDMGTNPTFTASSRIAFIQLTPSPARATCGPDLIRKRRGLVEQSRGEPASATRL